MEDILRQIGDVLNPDTIAHFFLYTIILLSVIMIATIPEKNDIPLYLMFGTVILSIFDVIRSTGQVTIEGAGNTGFLTFFVHLAIALFPLVAGAMTRKQGKKGGAALPLGILITLIGAVFAIGSYVQPATFYAETINLF